MKYCSSWSQCFKEERWNVLVRKSSWSGKSWCSGKRCHVGHGWRTFGETSFWRPSGQKTLISRGREGDTPLQTVEEKRECFLFWCVPSLASRYHQETCLSNSKAKPLQGAVYCKTGEKVCYCLIFIVWQDPGMSGSGLPCANLHSNTCCPLSCLPVHKAPHCFLVFYNFVCLFSFLSQGIVTSFFVLFLEISTETRKSI